MARRMRASLKLVKSMAYVGLLAALLCGSGRAVAAESRGEFRDFVVRTWGKAEGLPDTSVTAILQTRDAYLWVGTGAGLVRFDGVRFTETPLRVTGNNPPVAITALCEDTRGRLWIGSQQQGLFCLADGAVKHYGQPQGLLDEHVTSLAIDAHDDLWIGTRHGVNHWNGRSFMAFTSRDGLPDDFVTGVHAARSGGILITTRGGMCRLLNHRIAPFEFEAAGQGRNPEFLGAYEDLRGNLWAFGATYLINLAERKRFNYFHGNEPASRRIWSLCEGRDGRLWIGTSGRGLFCFDGQRFQPVMLSEVHQPNDVRAICEDSEGNLWLGISGGGLVQLRPLSFTLIKGSQGLPAGAATCLALDALGRLQVALESGGVFVNLGQRFERFSDRTGSVGQDAESALCAGLDGSLWVGTAGTGMYRIRGGRAALFTTANGLSDNCVLAMCAATDASVWVGTRAGMLHRFKDKEETLTTFGEADGLPGVPVTALHPGREGEVWIGTELGMLLHGKAGPFQRVPMAAELTGKSILSLYSDKAGRLWIGTAGGGLGCLDNQRCLVWGSQNGLPDEVVSGVVDDAEGNLWLTTGKGVCRVAHNSIAVALAGQGPLKSKLMFESEPVPNPGPTLGGPRALRSPEGALWFATPNGLVTMNSRDGEAEKAAPPVRLEAVLVDNHLFKSFPSGRPNARDTAGSPLRLPANLRTLEVQFTAPSFVASEKIRFRHKLAGLDPDWVESGPERRVLYGRLPDGRYEFHVTACQADGVWNETGARFAFTVPTPLWRAPWVLGFYGLTATGMVVGMVRLGSHRRLRRRLARLEQQRAMERERMRIAQDMHDEIGSKLTKISFLSERAKVELKETGPVAGQIDSIAHTSRELLQALDEIVWAVNPRNDTLEHLAAYLAQYAAEYFQNTTVDCDLRLQAELPPQVMSAETRHNLFLAFEECLNNVLKHSGASHVQVEIKADPGQLQIAIGDNGRGFERNLKTRENSTDSGSNRNGLRNIHQRLAEVGGQCHIQSRPGEGTTVRLHIPLSSAKFKPA